MLYCSTISAIAEFLLVDVVW